MIIISKFSAIPVQDKVEVKYTRTDGIVLAQRQDWWSLLHDESEDHCQFQFKSKKMMLHFDGQLQKDPTVRSWDQASCFYSAAPAYAYHYS